MRRCNPAVVYAPFDAETIERIRKWQDCPWTHDLTCNGHSVDRPHETATMQPVENGLLCTICGSLQGWVPRVCLNLPPDPAMVLFRQSNGQLAEVFADDLRPRETWPMSPILRGAIILALVVGLFAWWRP